MSISETLMEGDCVSFSCARNGKHRRICQMETDRASVRSERKIERWKKKLKSNKGKEKNSADIYVNTYTHIAHYPKWPNFTIIEGQIKLGHFSWMLNAFNISFCHWYGTFKIVRVTFGLLCCGAKSERDTAGEKEREKTVQMKNCQ